MTDNKISALAKTINDHLGKRLHNCELSNLDKVSIIDTVGSYLNLMTFTDYAKRENIEYNGVKYRIRTGKVQVMELFKVKFIIDNQ